MSVSRLNQVLLAAYPLRFRERYREEMTLVSSESGSGWRVSADLAKGALSAWLHPDIGTRNDRRRDRMQASVGVVFLAWCACVCGAGVFSKAVDDSPAPGLRSWGWTGFSIARGVFEVTAAGVLFVGLIYWLQLVIPAVRSRNRGVLVPALAPFPIVGVWLGATALVAWYARNYVHGPNQHPGALGLVILSSYLIVTILAVAGCGVSAVRALDAASLSTNQLQPAVILVCLGAIALFVQSVAGAVALTRVLEVGGIGIRGVLLALPPVVVMVCSALVALLSTVDGIRALCMTADSV